MYPTPTPGPMVPRPAPTPRAIAWRPFPPELELLEPWAISSVIGCRSMRSSLGGSVSLGSGGAADVDGSERGEDECLEGGDKDHLEDEEDNRNRHCDGADRCDAEQDDEPAAHEQDQQVAGQQVGEQSHRQRDDPDEVRDHLDQEDRAAREAGDARGNPGRQVAAEAVLADALDVVAEPHDQSQHQGHRYVRRRRVDRERRDLQPEQVERLLAVRRQRQVAEQVREPDEEERGGAEGEPLERVLAVHVPERDVVAREVVGGLDRRLDAVRLRLHALRDPHHHRDGERGREEQVEHRLVDAQVEPADLDLDPRIELELVLRLVVVVAALVAERGAENDRQPDHQAEAEEDLGLRAQLVQPLGHMRGGPCSNGRSASPIPKEMVNAARNSTAAHRPALLPAASPTPSSVKAIRKPRPSMLATRMPATLRGSSDLRAWLARTSRTTRWIT